MEKLKRFVRNQLKERGFAGCALILAKKIAFLLFLPTCKMLIHFQANGSRGPEPDFYQAHVSEFSRATTRSTPDCV